jgi:hypothetical protein
VVRTFDDVQQEYPSEKFEEPVQAILMLMMMLILSCAMRWELLNHRAGPAELRCALPCDVQQIPEARGDFSVRIPYEVQ